MSPPPHAPAAVIVFFVLSGFFIHWPNVEKQGPVGWREFYARRFLRLMLPLGAAQLLALMLPQPLLAGTHVILWSLVAEEIYYALYPALRWASQRISWNGLLGVAFLLFLGVILTNPKAGNYPSYGTALNWLLGLPCWLLGCRLAESIRRETPELKPGFFSSPWPWRLAVLGGSIGCSVLRFHSPLGYPWTLNLFALGVGLWLRREIIYYKKKQALPWLEWAGLASYSLYLLHLPAQALWTSLPAHPSQGLDWVGRILFAFLLSYLFHRVVEQPSHALARRAGARLSLRPAPNSQPQPVLPRRGV